MGKSLKGQELGKGISQRPDGLFVARKMINGRTISVSNTSLTVLRAQFKEAVYKEKNRLTGKTTFEEWYHVWYDTIKRKTLKGEISEYKFRDRYESTYLPLIGGMQLENIRQIDIQRVTNEMIESGRGAFIIEGALSATRQVFKHAVINGLIPTNPCVDIYISKKGVRKNPSRALEDWVVDAFFDALKKKSSIALFKFLLYSGVRIGELAALRWSDVDFENGTIQIERSLICHNIKGRMEYEFVAPKSESGIRIIPFLGGMEEVLKEWRVERELLHEKLMREKPETYKEEYRDLVFVTPRYGTPYICQNFEVLIKSNRQRMMKRESELAAQEERDPRTIQSIHPHLFRHTFATKCFEAGASPVYVQTLMGHSAYNTTVAYTHTTERVEKEQIWKINQVMRRF